MDETKEQPDSISKVKNKVKKQLSSGDIDANYIQPSKAIIERTSFKVTRPRSACIMVSSRGRGLSPISSLMMNDDKAQGDCRVNATSARVIRPRSAHIAETSASSINRSLNRASALITESELGNGVTCTNILSAKPTGRRCAR